MAALSAKVLENIVVRCCVTGQQHAKQVALAQTELEQALIQEREGDSVMQGWLDSDLLKKLLSVDAVASIGDKADELAQTFLQEVLDNEGVGSRLVPTLGGHGDASEDDEDTQESLGLVFAVSVLRPSPVSSAQRGGGGQW